MQQEEEQNQEQQQQQVDEPVDVSSVNQRQDDRTNTKLQDEDITKSVILGDFQNQVDSKNVQNFVEQFGQVKYVREKQVKGSENKQYIITFEKLESVSKLFAQCGYYCVIEEQTARIKLIKHNDLKINLRYIDKRLDDDMVANTLREFIKEENPDKEIPIFTCQFQYQHNEKEGAYLQLVSRQDMETVLRSVNKKEFSQKLAQQAFPDQQLKLIESSEINTRNQLKQQLQNEGEFLQILAEISDNKPKMQQRHPQQRGFQQGYNNRYQQQRQYQPRFQDRQPYQQRGYQQRQYEQKQHNTNKYPEENSVYVTNMPQSTPREQLEDMFKDAKPVEIYFKKQKDSNKQFCSAVCYFDTAEKARSVLNKDYQISGRQVYVKENRRNEIREQQYNGGYDNQ